MLISVNRLISNQLSKLINEKGLKDIDILKKCGFTRPTLAKIKNEGNINVETLVALANGLGVKVGYFFGEDDNANDVIEFKGKQNVQAKHIDHIEIDNKKILDINKSQEISDKISISEKTEEFVLPNNCEKNDKHIIEKLKIENDMLYKLLQEKERIITILQQISK